MCDEVAVIDARKRWAHLYQKWQARRDASLLGALLDARLLVDIAPQREGLGCLCEGGVEAMRCSDSRGCERGARKWY